MRPHAAQALPSVLHRPRRRWEGSEILDDPRGVSDAELDRSLRAMSRVNRYLGGTRGLFRHLAELARSGSLDALTVLDVGVGRGDVPRDLVRRLSARGIDVRWVGVDLTRRVLKRAAAAGRPADSSSCLGLIQGDGIRLPFRDEAFDVAISSLTLHHLDASQARRFLTEVARVVRIAVLVSDLERSRLHYLGARLLAATCWRRDPITRFDGPVSVLRSFTAVELAALGREAGFSQVRIRRYHPFRLVLEGRP
jgi:SAM-dependent methyltransferase